MIIVRIIGGLGNQMFQYAAARALSEVHQTRLKLDISHFKNYHLRTYGLDCFTLQAQFASQWEISRLNWAATKGLFYRLYLLRKKLKPYRSITSFTEKASYDKNIWNTPENVYLNGYFQSERYFTAKADLIRSEFAFRDKPIGKNQEIAKQITECHQSVSIHIRRGDYVADEEIRRLHGGICDLDYYQRCVLAIVEKISSPHFYIFSDDPAWCIENLKLPFPSTYITQNNPPHEDLRLMSLCRHHIIANSSFSWWGAWLQANPDKIVLAPKRWFNDPNKDIQYITPEKWITI